MKLPFLRGLRRLFANGNGHRPDGCVPDFDDQLQAWAGHAHTRFSLRLVRHEANLPYRGDELVNRPSRMAAFAHTLLESEPYECLGVVFLNSNSKPIGHSIPFRGTIGSCRVEPRAILLTALLVNSTGIVVVHAHPGGDPTPSRKDLDFADRLRRAGHVVGVSLCDFLILGEPPTYYSVERNRRNREPVPPEPPRSKKRKPKYRHPDDGEQTWVGTGFMPVWLREEIERGASLADFVVDGATVTEAAARQANQVRERALRRLGEEGEAS
jgi:hypothetical protein